MFKDCLVKYSDLKPGSEMDTFSPRVISILGVNCMRMPVTWFATGLSNDKVGGPSKAPTYVIVSMLIGATGPSSTLSVDKAGCMLFAFNPERGRMTPASVGIVTVTVLPWSITVRKERWI